MLGDQPLQFGRSDVHSTADHQVLAAIQVAEELSVITGNLEDISGAQESAFVER
ncbi:Uncharacterised protein [Mycobacteroides abscessus subsp. abscessus]|nr:Uncharacterised protein [Mycobacteroides abscessus subsp. abscessus]